jgi:hypothetical protein
MRLKLLPVAIAIALLVSSGVVHGLWTNRWHNSDALMNAVARVEQVPRTVGPWNAQTLAPPDVDPAAFAKSGALGYWMRRYVNHKDGSQVIATLMCGQHGDIAVHPPEVCYTASGYDMVERPVLFVVKTGEASAAFRTTVFAPAGTEATSKRLRIFWSWNATGDWLAPEGDARWTFRGAPFLYKLYVAHEITGPAGPPDSDPCAALLPLLLPQLQTVLFPSREE